MPKEIVIVEDNTEDSLRVIQCVQEAFPDGDFRGTAITSESAFCTTLPRMQADPPALVFMNIVLRWDDPRAPRQKPPEMEGHGPHLAGFRCLARLATHLVTKDIPVILYTDLDPSEFRLDHLPPNARFLPVREEAGMPDFDNRVVKAVREFL